MGLTMELQKHAIKLVHTNGTNLRRKPIMLLWQQVHVHIKVLFQKV